MFYHAYRDTCDGIAISQSYLKSFLFSDNPTSEFQMFINLRFYLIMQPHGNMSQNVLHHSKKHGAEQSQDILLESLLAFCTEA